MESDFMKQYFNIYVVFDREHNTRMFRETVGVVDSFDIPYYRLSYCSALDEFEDYKKSHESDDLILLIENEIPKEGTVFNFVPRRDYVKED